MIARLPTRSEWSALPKRDRLRLWQHLTPDQRDALFRQIRDNTPIHSLPYPSDYQDPADSPTALRQLAQATEAAIETRAPAHSHPYAEVIPPNTWVGDYQLSAASFLLGTIGPGQEAEIVFGINPGTFCVCTVQHPSTWLITTYNDRGDGTAAISVRNSTESTTHDNIKVHAFFINLPG